MITITSNGTPQSTTITDAKTGTRLEGVQSVDFRLAVGETNQARLCIDLAKITSVTLDAYVGSVRDTMRSISYEFDTDGTLTAIILPKDSKVVVRQE